jgi:hypothetical protein
MITISTAKIYKHHPCFDGFKTLLESKGLTISDDAKNIAHLRHLISEDEFPLADVVKSNGLDDALWCLRCLPEHGRLWRKYAVWCARQVQHLMADDRSIKALDVAWAHSDGLASDEELAAAWDAARDAAGDAARAAAWDAARAAAWAAARAAARDAAGDAARDAARAAAGAAAWAAARDAAGDAAGEAAGDAAWEAQKEKLIQILTAEYWV